MKMVEARDILFKDYIEWLKEKKGATPERFSMDIWASRIFDLWYGEYAEEKKKQQLSVDVIKIFSAQELEDLLHKKKVIDIRKRQERDIIQNQRKAEIEAAKAAPKVDEPSGERVPDNVNAMDEVTPTEEEMKAMAEAQSGVTDIPVSHEPKVVAFPKKKGLFGFLKK